MPSFFLKLLFAVPLVVMSLTAHTTKAATCDMEKTPLVFSVEEIRSDVTLDHSKSSSEIENILVEYGGKSYLDNIKSQINKDKNGLRFSKIDGLTRAVGNPYLNLVFIWHQIADKTYCVYASEATIRVGFEKMLVYVNRRHDLNSCRYKVILAHELEHVSRNYTVLTHSLPTFQKIEISLKEMPIRNGLDADKIQQEILDDLFIEFKKAADILNRDLIKENANLDTLETYLKDSSKCPKTAITQNEWKAPEEEEERIDP